MNVRRSISLVLVVLALGVVPRARADAPGQTDYTAVEGLSQPVYGRTVHAAYHIPAADGRLLYVEVTRPLGAGRVPVIAELSPYHGTVYARDGMRLLPFDGGLVKYFVPRGYAVMMMDLRGTGRSEGCLDLLGPTDRADIKRVIEWAASRPWSSGRVAAVGHSYPAAAAIAAVSMRPKGLVTAVVSSGLSSMYDHQFQGGVPYDALWLGPIEAYYALSVARQLPPGFTLPDDGEATGDDFGNDMQDFGCGARSSAATKGAAEFTGQYTQWDRDRDFGAAAAASPIPVFAIHGVNDDAARVIMLDWFFGRHQPADKLWLGQWTHGVGCCPNQRGEQWTGALHAWLDEYLQQRSVDTGPPVEVFLADGSQSEAVPAGRTQVFAAPALPPPRMVAFYPSDDGAMSTAAGGPGSSVFTGDPFGSPSLSFSTRPFQRDALMVGIPQLTLVAATTAPMTYLIGTLYEERSDGQLRRLSVFAINTVLRDGRDHVAPVLPLQRYVMHPPGWPMAQNVRRGDRLVLEISTADNDKFPFFSTDPYVQIFTGRGGTSLRVPIVDNAVLHDDTVPLK